MREPAVTPEPIAIEPNPWTRSVVTTTTATLPCRLTRWEQIIEYLRALYR